MDFTTAVEDVACALFTLTVVGVALMTVELFRDCEPIAPASSDEQDDMAIW